MLDDSTHALPDTLCEERTLDQDFNNPDFLLSFDDSNKAKFSSLPENSENLSFSEDHVLGCTFDDIGVNFDLLAAVNQQQLAATIRTYNKYPTAMIFHGSWGQHQLGPHKKQLRILIDSGSSIPCIVNKRSVEITPQKMRSSRSEPYRVRTGSGVIETNATVWHNQHLQVGDSSIALSKVTALDLKSLPYDMILGYPFLTQHSPIPNWKTGELQFKKFKWSPVADYTNEKERLSSLCILDSEDMKRLVLRENNIAKQRAKRGEEHVRPYMILASMSDVLGDTGDNILDLVDPERSGAEKRDATLAPGLTPAQRNQMHEMLKPYTDVVGGGQFTEKDNLYHRDDPALGPKERLDGHAMRLEVDESATPPHAKPRHMGPKEKAELKRQLIWLLTHGFIQPSKSRYSSPVLFVKKSDGTLRFCIDYRAINDITSTEHFPLPRIPELIDTLSQSNYFTALDAVQGYHQFRLDESSFKYTAFTCPFGHFEYRVIPFGLKNAVGHYQGVLSSYVGPGTEHSSYCANLIDDVLVHSKTFEEHVVHVKAVLDTLANKAGLYMNLKKCMFAYKEIKWMGHILGGGHRKPDPAKIKAVCEYPLPTTVSEVRSLLGVINYLGDYIPHLQQILHPFASIRSGGKKEVVKLNEEQLEAWEVVKRTLTSDVVLKLPDFNKTFFLQTDASEFALGACLMQPHDDKLFPVEYYSRTFKDAQLNYAIYDKELLAMQEGMRKFRPYLQHDRFVLLTDHKPLTHLRTQESLNMRQLRFLEFDAEYDYKVVYIKGEDNIFADFLSRPPDKKRIIDKSKLSASMVSSCALCRAAEIEDVYAQFDKYPHSSHSTQPPRSHLFDHTCQDDTKVTQGDINEWMSHQGHQDTDDWTLTFDTENKVKFSNAKVDDYLMSIDFAPRLERDPSLCDRKCKQTLHTCEQFFPFVSQIRGVEEFDMDEIREGYAHDKLANEILTELRSPFDTHHYNRKYQEVNGLLYLLMGDKRHIFGERDVARIYVPDHGTLRERLIRYLHSSPTEGHRDGDATYLRVAERLYFPGMYKLCMSVVKKCEACQKAKYIPATVRELHQPLEAPSKIPWTDIATDFICGLPVSICQCSGEKFDKIQVYVCRLSRKVHLVPGKSTDTAEMTASRYRDRVFPHDGIPLSVVSDRDPVFANIFWTHLSRLLGVRLKMSSGHRPQTDGLSERMVGVVTTMLSIFINYRQNDWANYLGMFQFALNRNVVANRGKASPFEISQGYNPFAPVDAAFPKRLFQRTDAAKDYVLRQRAAAQHALDSIQASADVVARRMNGKANRKLYNYKVGDKCFIDKTHVYPEAARLLMSQKLRLRWVGPYTIEELVGHHAVRVNLSGDKLLNHNVYHVESTKPCNPGTHFKESTEVEPGEWLVEGIKLFNYVRNKPFWVVDWGGITINGSVTTSRHTKVPLADLLDKETGKPIDMLVQFEKKRTHLEHTLDFDWEYTKPRRCGTVTTQPDGWRVYFSKPRETTGTIAAKLKIDWKQLYDQNVINYAMKPNIRGAPQGKNKIAHKQELPPFTQLRLPRPA